MAIPANVEAKAISPLASIFSGSFTQTGNHWNTVRIASNANISVKEFLILENMDSIAWLNTSSPVAIVNLTDNPVVNTGSTIDTFG